MSRRMITSTLILFLLSCGSVAVAQDGLAKSRLAAKYLIQDDSDRPQLESAAQDEEAESEQQVQPEELTTSPSGWQLKSIREIKLDVRDNAERTPTDRSYELAQYGRPGDLATTEKSLRLGGAQHSLSAVVFRRCGVGAIRTNAAAESTVRCF